MHILLPGKYTSSDVVFRKIFSEAKKISYLPFHKILDQLEKKAVDAAVLIHEERQNFENKSLFLVADLAKEWFNKTGHFLPLGCLVVKNELSQAVVTRLEKVILESIRYAKLHKEEIFPYIKKYAQNKDKAIIWEHIKNFVNSETLSLSKKSFKNIEYLTQA